MNSHYRPPRQQAGRAGFTAFQVADVHEEYERLKQRGVEVTMEPTNMGTVIMAVLDDTCGNLIQIYQVINGRG